MDMLGTGMLLAAIPLLLVVEHRNKELKLRGGDQPQAELQEPTPPTARSSASIVTDVHDSDDSSP